MIPAARARKCQIHGVEWDGMESSECPVCRERDRRRELEREAQQAAQLNHRLIKQLAPFVVALAEQTETDTDTDESPDAENVQIFDGHTARKGPESFGTEDDR